MVGYRIRVFFMMFFRFIDWPQFLLMMKILRMIRNGEISVIKYRNQDEFNSVWWHVYTSHWWNDPVFAIVKWNTLLFVIEKYWSNANLRKPFEWLRDKDLHLFIFKVLLNLEDEKKEREAAEAKRKEKLEAVKRTKEAFDNL